MGMGISGYSKQSNITTIEAVSEYWGEFGTEKVTYHGTEYFIFSATAKLVVSFETGKPISEPIGEPEVSVRVVSILKNGKVGGKYQRISGYGVNYLEGFEQVVSRLKSSCYSRFLEESSGQVLTASLERV